MSRARLIAAARLEFPAQAIYYSEAEAGLGGRFTAAHHARRPYYWQPRLSAR